MQQLERQVIDAERQAEKAFQQVEHNLIFTCLYAYKDCLAHNSRIAVNLPEYLIIVTAHELSPQSGKIELYFVPLKIFQIWLLIEIPTAIKFYI